MATKQPNPIPKKKTSPSPSLASLPSTMQKASISEPSDPERAEAEKVAAYKALSASFGAAPNPIASPVASKPIASPIASKPIASPIASKPIASPIASKPIASKPRFDDDDEPLDGTPPDSGEEWPAVDEDGNIIDEDGNIVDEDGDADQADAEKKDAQDENDSPLLDYEADPADLVAASSSGGGAAASSEAKVAADGVRVLNGREPRVRNSGKAPAADDAPSPPRRNAASAMDEDKEEDVGPAHPRGAAAAAAALSEFLDEEEMEALPRARTVFTKVAPRRDAVSLVPKTRKEIDAESMVRTVRFYRQHHKLSFKIQKVQGRMKSRESVDRRIEEAKIAVQAAIEEKEFLEEPDLVKADREVLRLNAVTKHVGKKRKQCQHSADDEDALRRKLGLD